MLPLLFFLGWQYYLIVIKEEATPSPYFSWVFGTVLVSAVIGFLKIIERSKLEKGDGDT